MVKNEVMGSGAAPGDLVEIRMEEATVQKRGPSSLNLLELEITWEGNRLKLSAQEQRPGVESTIRHYEEIRVSMDMIQTRCRNMVDTLNQANRKGRLNNETLVKLREIGQVLHDELFSLGVKEKLSKTNAEYMKLKIDDKLVHIPWELLNDGRQFLCQHFNMGRLVKTRQPLPRARSRLLAHPLRMLILADPEGDLKGAYAEGIQIRDYMDPDKDLINVSLLSGNIAPDTIKEKMRNFDFVHFAGHADYTPQNAADSGWQLTGGALKAADIMKMAGTATMPALIFSNACQSARTEQWDLKFDFENNIFGLANAFLLAGVKHYLGTFWEISDEPSRRFALKFYRYLLAGVTIGDALRRSRLELIKEYGAETIVWASYVLYGDPTSNYKDEIENTGRREEPEPVRVAIPGGEIRTGEAVIDFAEKEVKKKNWMRWTVAAGVVLLALIMLWGYPGFLKKGAAELEHKALAYYNAGDFKATLKVCQALEEKHPAGCLIHMIRGNINFVNGKLDAAEDDYNRALQSSQGTELQKAQALLGLGRVASFQKNSDLALKFYQRATQTAPASKWGYLSQALLLESSKDYDNALGLLKKAQALSPQDLTIKAITKQTREKAILARDKKNQDRIDRLVKELLDSMKSPSRGLPGDGWTTPPLTLWVMDMRTEGHFLQEGLERLLVAGISDQILQHSCVRLVERALFDKLIEELKLGSSELVDQRSALALGRILAARLILVGQLFHHGPQVQVSLRLIETETGQITAAVNQSYPCAEPASSLTENLSKELLQKIFALYPVRGKISEVNGEAVGLNIGAMAGVSVGQRYKVLDESIILEVVSVEQDTSLARIAEGKSRRLTNLRVEIADAN